ncbi:pulmonary surfactant-associated protein A [Alligator mississippiensis]|uniref:pulmonary surfactant-associated protein A n=1 Tax=Alligator mississippiensis TaxID=8496 RepID=UPI00090702DD|nr:pulmonary surfactant-associated protein A [Alligator mississippiensis]
MMLSPQLFHVTTALALLLVTSYAEKECIGICGKGNQGTKAIILTKQLIEYGRKLFATNGKSADFETIFNMCKNAGGFIASPKNKGENNAILEFVRHFNPYAYLGIKESLNPGEFLYLDGTELSYTNWYPGEPSDRRTEACAEMYIDGTWNDKKMQLPSPDCL